MRPAPEPTESRPDMTPMIDVVFLMIVFFVCIDFRVLEAKLPAWLPKDQGRSVVVTPPEPTLSVRVHVATRGTPVYRDGAANGAIDPATGRPARYTLVGHTVLWEVGPRTFGDLAAARRELERLAADPQCRVPDPVTGERRLLRCVVEGTPGVRYDDVARTADACHAAGFTDIAFGSS